MSYRIEFLPAVVFVVLITVLCVPGLSLLIALILVSLAAMAVLALVGAVLALPYLLVRSVGRRLAARSQSTSAVTEIPTFRAELSRPQVG
jgi:hypothetical protein